LSNADHCYSFVRDRRASIAPLFAMCLGLLLLTAGIAVDVTRWLHARSKAQAALSAAILAGARMLQISPGSRDQAVTSAALTFEQNRSKGPAFEVETLIFDIGRDGLTFTARAAAWLPTTVLRLIGITRLSVLDAAQELGTGAAGHTRASSGPSQGTSLEVALALDLSGERPDARKLESGAA
jgi:hypothetical protein